MGATTALTNKYVRNYYYYLNLVTPTLLPALNNILHSISSSNCCPRMQNAATDMEDLKCAYEIAREEQNEETKEFLKSLNLVNPIEKNVFPDTWNKKKKTCTKNMIMMIVKKKNDETLGWWRKKNC